MKQTALLILLLTFSVTSTCGQRTLKTTKWKTVDLSFKLKKEVDNPFQVALDCEFIAEDGFTIKVPGFYNGDNEWVVRFNPNKVGIWTAISSSSIKKLSGKKYKIQVDEAKKEDH